MPSEVRHSAGQLVPVWQSIPLSPAFVGDEVHVWSLALSGDEAGHHHAGLAPEEQAHADTLRIPAVRRNFVCRRAQLRRVLAGYLGVPSRELAFITNAHGKPALANPEIPALRFSYTHSADLALLAVACDRELGVDVEHHRPRADALGLARRWFAAKESAALAALPEAAQSDAFYTIWTRKEAFVKALGLGLSFPLDEFVVSECASAVDWLLEVRGDIPAPGQWTTATFSPGVGFSAALMFAGEAAPIHWFRAD